MASASDLLRELRDELKLQVEHGKRVAEAGRTPALHLAMPSTKAGAEQIGKVYLREAKASEVAIDYPDVMGLTNITIVRKLTQPRSRWQRLGEWLRRHA